jgi:hypothetical protein
MRNITVFAGAALAALMAAGGAQAQSGYVGLSYQSNDVGGGSDVDSTAVSGAVALGPNFQVNGRYASVDAGGGDIDAWSIDGFLFSRSSGGAFGGFLGYDTFDSGSSADEWSVGGFAELYSGNTNWTAQLGYADTEGDVSVIHLDGQGRFFPSPDFSLQGNLGYGDVDVDGGGDTSYWSAGLGGEFQLTGTPVSIYGGWQHYDIDGGDETDAIGIGARWNFGGLTLMDRSRTGASYERVTPTFFELLIGGGVTPR